MRKGKVSQRMLLLGLALCLVGGIGFLGSFPLAAGSLGVGVLAPLSVSDGVRTSGLVEKKDLADLIGESSLVVRGKVEQVSPPFQIQGVGGGVLTFRDSILVPEEVYRGQPGEVLVVRTQDEEGATVETQEPVLQEGKEYVLFLYRPGRGGGYNTRGDYHYITGLKQGVLEKTGDTYTTQDGTGTAISSAALFTALQQENEKAPVNEEKALEEFLANLQGNLKSGFISQEEYDRILKESQEFAKILD